MIGVDTNVLVRWISRDDPQQTAAADEFFAGLTNENRGFVSQISLAEVAWVLRRSLGFSTSGTLDVLEDLLLSEELEFDEGEGVWRALLEARAGTDFADALIADAFNLFGCIDAVTFDRDAARRFGWRLLS